ncbi:hypothetical protein KDI_04300 [Dictyobacter arantiisoli]|uniref:Uncharacterized protein n=1 Tax=Dictyobacter arantiisoli TaxID=2014874 RepID=A0A5A5T6Q6_9CHLR|nr:hypothetical protein KDI_04300 [Dictyobacter arantiisoli]
MARKLTRKMRGKNESKNQSKTVTVPWQVGDTFPGFSARNITSPLPDNYLIKLERFELNYESNVRAK